MTEKIESVLSPQQIASFHRRGVLKVDFGFDPSLLEAIVEKVHRYYPEEYRRGEAFSVRVQDAWKRVDEARQLAVHTAVTTALGELRGRRALPFQTLNFPVATGQAAHSDNIHFSSDPAGYMMGVWVALEDIDENNGPLFYYPGSHLLPMYSMQDFNLEAGIDQYPEYELGIGRIIQENNLSPEIGLAKKGEAIIWHANLLHGGAALKDSNRTRHSQVTHYYFEGCKYFTPLSSTRRKRQRRFPNWIPESSNYTLPEDRSLPVRALQRLLRKLRGG